MSKKLITALAVEHALRTNTPCSSLEAELITIDRALPAKPSDVELACAEALRASVATKYNAVDASLEDASSMTSSDILHQHRRTQMNELCASMEQLSDFVALHGDRPVSVANMTMFNMLHTDICQRYGLPTRNVSVENDGVLTISNEDVKETMKDLAKAFKKSIKDAIDKPATNFAFIKPKIKTLQKLTAELKKIVDEADGAGEEKTIQLSNQILGWLNAQAHLGGGTDIPSILKKFKSNIALILGALDVQYDALNSIADSLDGWFNGFKREKMKNALDSELEKMNKGLAKFYTGDRQTVGWVFKSETGKTLPMSAKGKVHVSSDSVKDGNDQHMKLSLKSYNRSIPDKNIPDVIKDGVKAFSKKECAAMLKDIGEIEKVLIDMRKVADENIANENKFWVRLSQVQDIFSFTATLIFNRALIDLRHLGESIVRRSDNLWEFGIDYIDETTSIIDAVITKSLK